MAPRPGIDQLRGDANPRVDSADAAFHDISHAELATEPLDVDILSPVLKRRVSCNDEQLTEPRELGDDVFGDAVDEILLLGIVAHIREW